MEITTMEELSEQKNQHQAGGAVSLRVSRSGETMDVQMTLQEVKQED